MNAEQDAAATLEKLRQCNEALLSERLASEHERKASARERELHAASTLELGQVITSLRWWAVFDLCWMVREMMEPARYAWGYPASWAYKLAALSAHPWAVVGWFTVATLLVIPLIFALAVVPHTPLCRRCEGLACFGLFMGGIGYAVLSSFAARLDVSHIVDSYRGNATMLLVTALLVACWHNSRVIRAHKAPARSKSPVHRKGDICSRSGV